VFKRTKAITEVYSSFNGNLGTNGNGIADTSGEVSLNWLKSMNLVKADRDLKDRSSLLRGERQGLDRDQI
jgi:hypothetical protein